MSVETQFKVGQVVQNLQIMLIKPNNLISVRENLTGFHKLILELQNYVKVDFWCREFTLIEIILSSMCENDINKVELKLSSKVHHHWMHSIKCIKQTHHSILYINNETKEKVIYLLSSQQKPNQTVNYSCFGILEIHNNSYIKLQEVNEHDSRLCYKSACYNLLLSVWLAVR